MDSGPGLKAWARQLSFSKAYSDCTSIRDLCQDTGRLDSTRLRYYLFVISLCLAANFLLLGYMKPSVSMWTTLVITRFVLLACADCLGEGLIVMIRKLEEDAKEFTDDVDNVNIVGTYLVARGFTRALASCLGAYAGINLDMRITYFVFAIAPVAMAFFAREVFFEIKVNEEDIDNNSSTLMNMREGFEHFRKTISVRVLLTHFGILILAGILPVGDLAHKQLFLNNVQQTSGEIILLVYLYQSILTFVLLGYVVYQYSKINKKYIAAGGLALILLSTLPPLVMANCSNRLKESTFMLLFLSTSFHLFSHLGMNLISLTYFSLLLPFSEDKIFSHLSLPSGIFRGALFLQPMIEQSLNNRLSRSAVAVGCWTLVSGLLATYLASEDSPDSSAEEAIMLNSYHKATKEKVQNDEERGFILDFSANDSVGLETSSEDPIKHF